ncbi:DNase I-like protein [Sistotremastrum suecicum HHB10207 ss-3]|uniref:DNase I-like protein n=1 Tax=Sistotremastrum suecicum HHB10207 ss-3 TaxID=1314776 RepID=A0A166DNC9_9AGAM|nr:DNase I-like protein [Sistotremastrum suecicum HHB10207 ss-3]
MDDITPLATPSSAPARLPPPPTRTIGIHDKLPPRRQTAGELESLSSAESEDDASTTPATRRSVDLAPDSSHSSRRPPTLPSPLDAPIHVSAHHAMVRSKGPYVVVASQHHFRIHTLPLTGNGASTVSEVDLGDIKKSCVTAMEWASGNGDMLWAGTNQGTLLLIDVARASIADTRSGWHSHSITHIVRHRTTMISLDETGKLVMFEPSSENMGKPRTLRMPDKTQFMGVFGDRIWSSLGTGSQSSAVRVYDVLPSQTSMASKPLLLSPTENIGPVTAGSYLPSRPSTIYLGHEGGYISVWDANDPQCRDVIKVGSSDILCLLGVGTRLWAGGRKGVISAYDVSQTPWLITNQWKAHEELPVLSLTADPFSIDPFGHLSVVSVGRDEKLRFWDGLLGAEWVDKEMLKREADFSTFRKLKVLICTWNVDAAKPEQLSGNIDDAGFLENLLRSVDRPDIICFGFQEMIDLENRRLTAKTVLLGRTKKKAGDHVSEKVSRSYKQWYDRLVFAVRLAMPPDDPYTVVHTENLVGLFTCIFVRNSERKAGSLNDERITTVKRGMGGRFGNKGAIVARFVVDDTSICFINCHLAAGQSHKRQRNNDLAAILEEKSVFPESSPADEALAYVGGGDGSMILDHEICFLNGDLNYRIDQRRDAVIHAIENHDLASLLAQDQLLKEMHSNPAFRLRSFREAPITFAPTYKYDRHSTEYDSSEKKRIPAWCDRILYQTRAEGRVVPLHYQRYEPKVSDHRPVSAGYEVVVKQISHERRSAVKKEVGEARAYEELKLFSEAKNLYRTLGIM